MTKLPLVVDLMKERRLPVLDATLNGAGKVEITWKQSPTDHEKLIAQSCTHYRACIHKWA